MSKVKVLFGHMTLSSLNKKHFNAYSSIKPFLIITITHSQIKRFSA